MSNRYYALSGIFGPLIAYLSIAVSIVFSPWFSWERNALSDLGHSVKSGVASVYNLGLLVAGFLLIVYAATVFKEHAKYTSVFLVISSFMLQLVATFDEVYGLLHFAVSLLFFILIGVSSIVYAVERRSSFAGVMFIVNFGSWILYGMRIYHAGIAVPETISSLAAVLWIILSAVKILTD